jgi:hypothetical protein
VHKQVVLVEVQQEVLDHNLVPQVIHLPLVHHKEIVVVMVFNLYHHLAQQVVMQEVLEAVVLLLQVVLQVVLFLLQVELVVMEAII